ncbi:hypothetical protein [Bacillus horti]|uniref:Uncharacterized protein n=1 Tax=Caldalkalibacillus horti TaxID=77523 RepID=A0ABT9VUR4_9BACI|nr:hypothetical protein [Bacillus horti]
MVGIGYILVHIAGVIVCWRIGFRGGFYFFLILSIVELYNSISPLFISGFIDSAANNLPHSITFGEFVAFITYVPMGIQAIAYLILIISLYKAFTNKKVFKKKEANTEFE